MSILKKRLSKEDKDHKKLSIIHEMNKAKKMKDKFIEKCINLNNEYVLRQLYVFVNFCENGFKSDTIIKTIYNVCYNDRI